METKNTTTETTIGSEMEISRGRKRETYQMLHDQQHPEAVKCPRCDSTNTKFCYYNNYNLAQPRYFCKTCRRYWTKGGALRNVPIGGGCRKSKKPKSSSSTSSLDSSTSIDLSGFKFFNGLPSSPAMDFQFGGLNRPSLSLNYLSSSGTINNQMFNSIGDIGSSFLANPNGIDTLDPYLGFNLYLPSYLPSMEHHRHIERPQQIVFQNLDISSRPNVISYEGRCGNLRSENLFDETYAPTINATTTIISNGANNWNENENYWNNESQALGNLGQFNEIP